jgi:ferredoxin-thioredoxin reductase catalytic subunit
MPDYKLKYISNIAEYIACYCHLYVRFDGREGPWLP